MVTSVQALIERLKIGPDIRTLESSKETPCFKNEASSQPAFNPMSIQIVLTAIEEALAQAWERFCGDLVGVHVYRGSILDTDCDAVVSPANSFGFSHLAVYPIPDPFVDTLEF